MDGARLVSNSYAAVPYQSSAVNPRAAAWPLSATLVLSQGGNVWEKAGVNISVVYGSMPPEAYRAATGVKSEVKKAVRRRTHARTVADICLRHT
jgi:hypothetical protein